MQYGSWMGGVDNIPLELIFSMDCIHLDNNCGGEDAMAVTNISELVPQTTRDIALDTIPSGSSTQ